MRRDSALQGRTHSSEGLDVSTAPVAVRSGQLSFATRTCVPCVGVLEVRLIIDLSQPVHDNLPLRLAGADGTTVRAVALEKHDLG